MYALILGVKGLEYVFMVDKKTRSTTPTLSMVLREGMTPQLETGIRHFVLECGPSYTIASRRYSIWSLLSRHIDSPVSEAFKRLGTPHLFEGSFSKWLRDSNMAAMRLFFKSLYRSNETNSELTANIESLVDLSYFILARHPSKKISVPGKRGAPQFNHRRNVDHRHYPYCELCWKFCQAAERNLEHPEENYATQRFCADHDPSIPHSKYRNDHRFRDRFVEELRKLKTIKRTEELPECNVRAIAYYAAHARKNSRSDEIIKLYRENNTRSEISKKLGISKQAVSKALNKQLKSTTNTGTN